VILVADDDAVFRTLLRAVLEPAGYRVIECECGDDALLRSAERLPDLVVADVCMPRGSGYELCRRLRSEFDSSPPILMVSGSRMESHDRAAGLELGADDYVVKPVDPEEFLARVRALLRRAPMPECGSAENTGQALTHREREVLHLLAEGVTQAQIAERLGIAPRTVGKHIERILPKLGAHSRIEAVVTAYQLGIEVSTHERQAANSIV